MKYYAKKSPLYVIFKEIFSICFEHNRNSIESQIHELKNIENFSSLEHGSKSDKSLSTFLKLCFQLC